MQVPFVDNLCGDITWSACGVQTVNCGPMKINGGGGWIGRGTMVLTYVDDRNVTGTVTYDVNKPCKVTFDVKAKKLDVN